MNCKAFVRLTRIDHAVFLMIAVAVGEIIALNGALPPIEIFLLSIFCPFFIEIGSFAINDYWDVKTDKKNKRKDRPLVTGEISPKTALYIAIFGFAIGIACSFFLNIVAISIAILFAILALYYSYILKKIAVIGNLAIAASMAIPFIFGNFVVSNTIDPAVALLALMALLMGFGREILKSIQDMKGDKKTGRRTLPILIGAEKAKFHGIYFILLAIFVSPFPLFLLPQYYMNYFYILFIVITDYLLLLACLYAFQLRKFNKIRKLTLLAQLTGLLGFLLGAIF